MSQEGVPVEIPDKLYFRIGEVSKLVGIEPYVLRFWESEFPALSPKKSDTGHRLFRRKDVELLLRIKDLLYTKRFTIEGARQSLNQQRREPKLQQELFPSNDLVPHIRQELISLLALLGANPDE